MDSSVLSLIDAFGCPACIVDANARLILESKVVPKKEREKLYKAARGKSVSLADPGSDTRLKAILMGERSDELRTDFIIVPPRSAKKSSKAQSYRTILHIVTLRTQSSLESDFRFLLVFRPFRVARELSFEAFAREFRITKREFAILEGISTGLGPAEYAEMHGLSVQTVRNQLGSAFRKCQFSRQPDFASLMTELSFFASPYR